MIKTRTRKVEDVVGLVLILAVIMALGAAIRLYYILQANFPLNDGGLFYQMTRELINNHYVLPIYTTYNGHFIPFAYPPLPFYIAGLLQQASGLGLIQVFRFLPFFFNLFTIPAFFFLSRQILTKDLPVVYATLIFAILPPSFEWLIMGGGIARSPAYLFSILAIWLSLRGFTRREVISVALATFFNGLTLLSHLDIALITCIWIAIAALLLSRDRWVWMALISLGFCTALVASPWWFSVISRFGSGPYLNALAAGEFSIPQNLGRLFFGNLTSEALFTPVLVFAFIGLVYALFQRDWLLPALFFAVVVFDSRGMGRSILIPISMLASITINHLLLPVLTQLNPIGRPVLRRVYSLVSLTLILYMLMRASLLAQLFQRAFEYRLDALETTKIQAMQWIEANLPISSRFLILTSPISWEANKTAEWFPALAQRSAVNTVQGTEWLPDRRFEKQKNLYNRVNECLVQDVECLEELERDGLQFSHIYLSGYLQDRNTGYRIEMPVKQALELSPAYQMIYSDDSVIIFEKVVRVP